MRRHLVLLAVALVSGCAASPAPSQDAPASGAGPSAEAALPTAWWNLSVDLSTLTSAQANGVAVHPTQAFSNCVDLKVKGMPILAGRLEASWSDPGDLALYTWQRDRFDPNATGRAWTDGPSVLGMDAPPTEERARDYLFAGVEAAPGQPVSAGTNVQVRLDVHLLLQAASPPGDDAVTLHGCSFDQSR